MKSVVSSSYYSVSWKSEHQSIIHAKRQGIMRTIETVVNLLMLVVGAIRTIKDRLPHMNCQNWNVSNC